MARGLPGDRAPLRQASVAAISTGASPERFSSTNRASPAAVTFNHDGWMRRQHPRAVYHAATGLLARRGRSRQDGCLPRGRHDTSADRPRWAAASIRPRAGLRLRGPRMAQEDAPGGPLHPSHGYVGSLLVAGYWVRVIRARPGARRGPCRSGPLGGLWWTASRPWACTSSSARPAAALGAGGCLFGLVAAAWAERRGDAARPGRVGRTWDPGLTPGLSRRAPVRGYLPAVLPASPSSGARRNLRVRENVASSAGTWRVRPGPGDLPGGPRDLAVRRAAACVGCSRHLLVLLLAPYPLDRSHAGPVLGPASTSPERLRLAMGAKDLFVATIRSFGRRPQRTPSDDGGLEPCPKRHEQLVGWIFAPLKSSRRARVLHREVACVRMPTRSPKSTCASPSPPRRDRVGGVKNRMSIGTSAPRARPFEHRRVPRGTAPRVRSGRPSRARSPALQAGDLLLHVLAEDVEPLELPHDVEAVLPLPAPVRSKAMPSRRSSAQVDVPRVELPTDGHWSRGSSEIPPRGVDPLVPARSRSSPPRRPDLELPAEHVESAALAS